MGSHGRKSVAARLKYFDKIYKYYREYKDPERSLKWNVKRFLTDNGMTAEEVSEIKRIMLE